MNTMLIEPFTLAFMQRAFLAGLCLALLLGLLGVFTSIRRMTFFSEGMAHASLAGIAIGILAGAAPLPIAMAWAMGVATAIYVFERRTRLSTDTLIGILFTASMSLGVVLMHYAKGYQPELLSYLFGSILSIRSQDLWIIALVTFLAVWWLFTQRQSLTFLSLSEENAKVAKVPVERLTYLFYLTLAVATVLGVKILGVILVPALLAIPAATGRILSKSFKGYQIATVIVAEAMVFFGLLFSYFLNWPSGATIVLLGSVFFGLLVLARR